MFSFLKKIFKREPRSLFNEEDTRIIVKAIRHAEEQTSGEVRVFVENRCRFMDALDRAAEIFFSLQMEMTEQRNAVLVYVALKDHQLAVFGDEGIHKKVGTEYWNKRVKEMMELKNYQALLYLNGTRSLTRRLADLLIYIP